MKKEIKGLYAIVDPSCCPDTPPSELASLYLQGGARVIQLRQKTGEKADIASNARKILFLKKEFDFTFILNDFPEIALAVEADGVHLGQTDMPVGLARELLGKNVLIGKSTHSLDQAQRALKEDVDYIALGAIFPTQAKPAGHPVVGLEVLSSVVKISVKPVVAIGGINRANACDVVNSGVSAISMISALCHGKGGREEALFFSGLFR